MSRVPYYYDEDDNLVEEPGLLCNSCSKLALIEKAEGSNMIEMPCTDIDDEYGHEEGDIHAHPECALADFNRWKSWIAKVEPQLKERGLL